jgi:hypothetical protein
MGRGGARSGGGSMRGGGSSSRGSSRGRGGRGGRDSMAGAEMAGGGMNTQGMGGAGEDEGSESSSRSRSGGSRASPSARGQDATVLLKRDHDRVNRLFERFERSGSAARREVFETIRNELQVHALIEEEIFYPALERQRQPELEDQVREAHQEHDEVKQLLARGDAAPDDGLESIVRSVREAVEHHVEEEEGEMFPRAREVFPANRLKELGAELEARRKQLVEQALPEMVEA